MISKDLVEFNFSFCKIIPRSFCISVLLYKCFKMVPWRYRKLAYVAQNCQLLKYNPLMEFL